MDPRVVLTLMDSLAVSEFLMLIGGPKLNLPQLNLRELQQTVAFPLDSSDLQELYCGMVYYTLNQWVSW
jgi:hypothetical protein